MPYAASCESSRNGEPGSSSVSHALARQQLAAVGVPLARPLAAALANLLHFRTQVGYRRSHGVRVLAEPVGPPIGE